jgi:hypothetical protein
MTAPADSTTTDLERELARTREALAEAERELAELRASRSAEMARLERQAYWPERWGVDLDALMAGPWRPVLRAAAQILRLVARVLPGRR